MLKFFAGSTSEHPFADLKEAKRVVDALAGADSLGALDELTQWLASIRAEPAFKPVHRAALGQLLDEAAQPHWRKLAREYLWPPRHGKAPATAVWEALHLFWTEDALTLAAVMESGAGGEELSRPMLTFLAVRGLRAAGQQMKWRVMRYGSPGDAVWSAIYRIYGAAEARGVSRSAVKPHADGVPSTPEQEFLHAAMFAACSVDALTPLEVELADRLIARFSPLFTLSSEQLPDTAYWLDLGSEHGPVRVQRPPRTPAAGLRFVGSGHAFEQVADLAQSARASGELPQELMLGGLFAPGVVSRVLEHLRRHWSPRPPQRRHRRHRVKAPVAGWGGFDGALEAIFPNHSLTFDGGAAERWIAEDVSTGGCSVFIAEVKGDWLRIGSLLAMQPERGANWLLGIVRRISRPAPQQALLGIQTLARTALPIGMRIELGATRSLDQETGILLDPRSEDEELAIIVRAGVHTPHQRFILELNGRRTVLLPLNRIEGGKDYEILRCRKLVDESL